MNKYIITKVKTFTKGYLTRFLVFVGKLLIIVQFVIQEEDCSII